MIEIDGFVWWIDCSPDKENGGSYPYDRDYTIHQQLIAQMMGWA